MAKIDCIIMEDQTVFSFVACLLIVQYMIVCYPPISHLITAGLIEGLELTVLTRCEWTLDI